MAKETVTKAKGCDCGCECNMNKTLSGLKWGFGFWLAGLTVLLLVMAVSTVLFYLT